MRGWHKVIRGTWQRAADTAVKVCPTPRDPRLGKVPRSAGAGCTARIWPCSHVISSYTVDNTTECQKAKAIWKHLNCSNIWVKGVFASCVAPRGTAPATLCLQWGIILGDARHVMMPCHSCVGPASSRLADYNVSWLQPGTHELQLTMTGWVESDR